MRTRNGEAKRQKTRHARGNERLPHGPSSSRTGSPGAESVITQFDSSVSRATTPPTSSASSPEPVSIACSRGTTVQVVIPPFFRDPPPPNLTPPVRRQFEAIIIPQFFKDPLHITPRSTFLGVIIPRFFGPRSEAPSVRKKRQASSHRESPGSSGEVTWTPIEGSSNLGYDEAVERISIRHRILANFRVLYGEINRGQYDLADQFDLICGVSSEEDSQSGRIPWISTQALVLFLHKAFVTIMTAMDDPTFMIRQTLMNTCHQLQTSTDQDGEEIFLDCPTIWNILLETCRSFPEDLGTVLTMMEESEEDPEMTYQFIPVFNELLQTAIDAHYSSALRKRQDSLGRPSALEAMNGKPESKRVQPQRQVNSQSSKTKQTARRTRLPLVDLDKKMADAVLRSSALAKDPEPLGMDPDGRIYWACCPGPLEQQHAEMILHPPVADDEKAREAILRRKIRIVQSFPKEDERAGMHRWSWILAVWGTSPVEKGSRSSRRKGKRRVQERWFGFHSLRDIRGLAAWLKETFQDQDDDGSVQILVDQIQHFSKVLEYRCKIADST